MFALIDISRPMIAYDTTRISLTYVTKKLIIDARGHHTVLFYTH